MSKLSRWARRRLGLPEVRLISNEEILERTEAQLRRRGLDDATVAVVLEVLRGLLG